MRAFSNSSFSLIATVTPLPRPALYDLSLSLIHKELISKFPLLADLHEGRHWQQRKTCNRWNGESEVKTNGLHCVSRSPYLTPCANKRRGGVVGILAAQIYIFFPNEWVELQLHTPCTMLTSKEPSQRPNLQPRPNLASTAGQLPAKKTPHQHRSLPRNRRCES